MTRVSGVTAAFRDWRTGRAGDLTAIHVPDESEEAVGDLLRCREARYVDQLLAPDDRLAWLRLERNPRGRLQRFAEVVWHSCDEGSHLTLAASWPRAPDGSFPQGRARRGYKPAIVAVAHRLCGCSMPCRVMAVTFN
jgi:hypothetical protein